MYKVIIWGTGNIYNNFINCIKLQEILNKIEVIAVTSNEVYISSLDSYKFVEKDKIKNLEWE